MGCGGRRMDAAGQLVLNQQVPPGIRRTISTARHEWRTQRPRCSPVLGGRRCRGTRQPAPDPRPQCVAGGHRRTEDLLGGKAARLFGSDRWRQRPRGQGVCRAGSACGAASTMARRSLRSGRVAARYHPLASERGNAGDVVQMVTPFVSGLTNQPQGGPLFSRETHDCPSPFGCAVATDFLHATANCCIEFV
jgi:hypothetical protein